MQTKLGLLIVALAVLLGATVFTHADARRNQPIKDDRNEAYDEFDRLLPMVKSGDESDADEVKKALSNKKSAFLTMAAVEAVRQAEIDQGGSGEVFLPEVLALMGKDFEKLHKEEIFTVNVIACLGKLADGEKEATLKVVRALLDWQRWSDSPVVRLRHMAERILMDLTGEDCAFNSDTLDFWEWWVRNQESKQDPKEGDKQPEKKSKTAPIIFKEPMVGTRVVFVIDVSDSMKWPIADKDLAKIKDKANNLDWTKMPDKPCPLDIAKAELAYSIDHLRPAPPEKGKVDNKSTRNAKDDPEARTFAIVTYSHDVNLFTTDGWVDATNKNCTDWVTKVDGLELETTTNIHGALLKAFKFNGTAKESDEPELGKDCVLNGAHTIVFLTDGYPTWSNDSESPSAKDEFGNPVGDGEYVKRDKLLELAAHLDRFRKVVINTVGIGIHDKKLMAGFAEISGGAYTDWGCSIDWK